MRCARCGYFNPPGTNATCLQCGTPLTLGADPVVRALLPVGRTALSIVAGYLGLACILCVPSPIALGIGIWAILDLRARPGMHGMGRAVFGVVMGALGTIALIVALVSSVMSHTK